jgi:hypothetical protein
MRLDMEAMRKIDGFRVSSIQNRNGDFCGVYTIPTTDEDGRAFRKLVGYADKSGKFIWVLKRYLKAL